MSAARLLMLAVIVVVGLCSARAAALGAVPEQFMAWGSRAKANDHLGEPALEARLQVNVQATAEEAARGFLVFSEPSGAFIKPDYVPAAGERAGELAAKDCTGQYGPVTFVVFALRGGEVGVTVSDLKGKEGGIPAENLDVRAVRYVSIGKGETAQTVPLLLERFEGKKVAAGRLQQFWITYYIPKGTAPGTYEGQVGIRVDGQQKLALPLKLTVYPFDLVEPDVRFYIDSQMSNEPPDRELVRKELLDQRCHGMTMAELGAAVTDAGDLRPEVQAAMLDLYSEVGFPSHCVFVWLFNRTIAEWLNTPDEAIKMYGAWFRYYPFSKELDDRYARIARRLDEEATRRGLRLVIADADEAGSHPWTIEAAQHYYDVLKAQVPHAIRELTCGGGWAMGYPEDQLFRGRIDVWTTNRWLPDKLAIVRREDPKAEIEVCNMAGPGSSTYGVQSARLVYGFYAWKARALGVTQWVYVGTNDEGYTWPAQSAAEGRVPTLHWEAVREGTKDRRYIATLEERLAGKEGKAADEARAFLDQIAQKIQLTNYDQHDPIAGGRVAAEAPGVYDQWRARIADFIEALEH